MRHIHLHPLGGAAGDMFAACLLDAFPEHESAVLQATQALAPVTCRLVAHDDGTLTGHRFEVENTPGHHTHDHEHHHTHGHHAEHGHVHWRSIRTKLEASSLSPAVRAHAVGIFALLAEAEGRVHGVPADQGTFHEVGAADSVADIVAAAVLIEAISPARWSIAPLPVGGGTIRTAHGLMPVPAPATARLLEGFAMQDDGIAGERVTPTGAAILRYLRADVPAPVAGTLSRSGHGFGSRRLPGVSNCLRALVFEPTPQASPGLSGHRELAVVSFEVDDQSGEDLATGIERIRATPGVHDVVQIAAFGKKSRLAVHVQVLTAPEALEDVVQACFRETTTIGLRTHWVQGRALARRFAHVQLEGQAVTVKLVERPDGALTGKAEADHLRTAPSQAVRVEMRQEAERLARAAAKDPA